MIGYLRGLSILFVEYLEVFQASTAKTALLMGIYSGVCSICALLSMHVLVIKIGIRKTVFLGALISTIGMATAIAPISIDFLIATHSVILGIGNSMIFGPGVLIIGYYFKKRHGLASAVSMAGISFGNTVYPPLIRFLLDEYGLQGTMIILTGVTMNMFVCAAIFIPIDTFKGRKKQVRDSYRENSEDTDGEYSSYSNQSTKPLVWAKRDLSPKPVISVEKLNTSTEDRVHVSGVEKSPKLKVKEHNLSYKGQFTDEQKKFLSYEKLHVSVDSPFLQRKRRNSNSSSLSRSTRNVLLYASNPDFGSAFSVVHANNTVAEDADDGEKRSRCGSLMTIIDLTLFKKPMFVLIVAYSFFCNIIFLNGAYIPALAKEKGVSQRDAAMLLTITGAIDFICRLFVGVIIDRGCMRVNKFMATGLALIGTAAQLTYFYNSYTLMLVFSCILGVSTCAYFAMIPAALVEFIGLELMGKTLGFVSLCHGISIAVANPIVGAIRDMTGSYCGAYVFIGCCSYIGAILLFCEPLVRKYSGTKNLLRKEINV